jgi:uncharacterized membrane protein
MRNVIAVVFAVFSGVSYGAADFAGALASKRNNASLVTIVVQIVSLVSLGAVLTVSTTGTIIATDMWWGALGGIGAAVALTTFYAALAEGPMSTAASVTALVGSLVPVLAGVALGEIPNRMTLFGMGIAIPAAIVVSVGAAGVHERRVAASPRARARDRARSARTRRLSLIAGLGFGLFFVALAQTSAEGGLYPLVGARVASIALLAVVLTGQKAWGVVAKPDWPAVIVAGLLDCAANSFYLLALTDGSFTWVAVVVSLYPVATVLLARFLLGEQITRVQTVGLVMAAVALVLVGAGAA